MRRRKPLGVPQLPIHIGGSSRAAARRAGRRGDGYFPGGMLGPHERARQLDLARTEAVAAGRDPGALEYTRWGSIDMPAERVDGLATEGVTRIVVGSTDPDNPFDELSRFAERFELGG
ncbi:LLM class flavin-dependent oxidoreductase [Nocardia ninae]|uniref:LLM class flavin-dependent oxidoreductase n=1 Tax=Nocardia ninae TaxID=356145 RepID=UPI001FE26E4E|nr:LLM class flavin-dependent oxidoreductase [Nocardia ninae]